MPAKVNQIYLFALCFAFFVTPVLPITQSVYLNSLDIYLLPLVGICFLFLGKAKPIFFQITIPILLIFCYLLFLEVVYQSGDMTGIIVFLRLIPEISVAYMLAYWFVQGFGAASPKYFFYFVFLIALIQGGVLWASFFIDEFRTFMDSIFWRQPDAPFHLVQLRVPAFSATGGDGLGMNQAVLCLVAAGYLFYTRGVAKAVVMFLMLFAMIGVLFTARYGLFIGLPILVLMYFNQSKAKLVNKFAILFLLLLLFSLTLYMSLPLISRYANILILLNGYEDPLARALAGFRNYGSSGEVEFSTLRVLFVDMLFAPDQPSRFLFGNGDFGQMPTNTVDADSGYVRMLFGMGLTGSTGYIFVFLFALFSVIRRICAIGAERISSFGSNNATALSVYILLVGLFVILGHFKIMYMQSRIVTVLFFTLVFVFHIVLSDAPLGSVKRYKPSSRKIINNDRPYHRN